MEARLGLAAGRRRRCVLLRTTRQCLEAVRGIEGRLRAEGVLRALIELRLQLELGEILPGRQGDETEFPRLRIDLPLLPGHVVTIEPVDLLRACAPARPGASGAPSRRG